MAASSFVASVQAWNSLSGYAQFSCSSLRQPSVPPHDEHPAERHSRLRALCKAYFGAARRFEVNKRRSPRRPSRTLRMPWILATSAAGAGESESAPASRTPVLEASDSPSPVPSPVPGVDEEAHAPEHEAASPVIMNFQPLLPPSPTRDGLDLPEATRRDYENRYVSYKVLKQAAHELRNSFTAIMGLMEIVEDLSCDSLAPEQKQIFKEIWQAIDYHRSQLSCLDSEANVLAFTAAVSQSQDNCGGRPVGLREIDLGQMLDYMTVFYKAECERRGLTLEVETDESIKGQFMADILRIQQVLHNYLSNAIKYTFEGSITLYATVEPAPRRAETEGIFRVVVRDTGIGLSAEDMRAVWDEDRRVVNEQTQNIPGTGTGLYMCKTIIERLGGEVAVRSVLGEGSEFEFAIPVYRVGKRLPNGTLYRAVPGTEKRRFFDFGNTTTYEAIN
eukprot:tig00000093_g3547.t1